MTQHLWDDKIGTSGLTDKRSSELHHLSSYATASSSFESAEARDGPVDRQAAEDDEMNDIVLAMMWVAMSTASAKGLAALARAAATSNMEAELARLTGDGASAHESLLCTEDPTLLLHSAA